nr:hypothetical protein [uncultured Undibacterium sp.]
MSDLQLPQLLAEIEEVIRTAPSGDFRVGKPDAVAWIGRATALVRRWNSVRAISFDANVAKVYAPGSTFPLGAMTQLLAILHEARHDLRLTTVGPLSVAIESGAVFDYFDEVRKAMLMARIEILFVDPYIDAEFASRYLPQVPNGVSVRLLTRKGIPALLPAVELARQQYQVAVQIRSSSSLHDRFLFIDGTYGYQSGASFKDGAKLSPTLVTEITDALPAILGTYESMWNSATKHP